MKLRLNPTVIGLKELPPEGRTFTYTQESGELNEALKDLIGTNPFVVEFHLTPRGNAFDLKGRIKTVMDLQCSLCAVDFKFPIEANLSEWILIQRPLAKGDHQSRANHAHEWQEDGPDYIQLASDGFDVAEYIHEVVALAEPIRPLGKPNCDVDCDNLKDRVQREWLSYGEQSQDPVLANNPFQVLEKVKLKS